MILDSISLVFIVAKKRHAFSLLFNQGEQLSECAPNAVGIPGTGPLVNSRKFIEFDGWHDLVTGVFPIVGYFWVFTWGYVLLCWYDEIRAFTNDAIGVKVAMKMLIQEPGSGRFLSVLALPPKLHQSPIRSWSFVPLILGLIDRRWCRVPACLHITFVSP